MGKILKYAITLICVIVSICEIKAVEIYDIEGSYVWRYIDFSKADAPFVEEPMKINVEDIYTETVTLSLGIYKIPAKFNSSDGSISIDYGTFIDYDANRRMDVNFYHGKWVPGNGSSMDYADAVFSYDGENFFLPEDETILIGNSTRGYLYTGRSNCIISTTSGVDAPVSSEVTVEYYTLYGLKLQGYPMQSGIFIKRTGPLSTKIYIK